MSFLTPRQSKTHAKIRSLENLMICKAPAETDFLPTEVSILAQTNGPWSANVKLCFEKVRFRRIAQQPRLPLCRTELW